MARQVFPLGDLAVNERWNGSILVSSGLVAGGGTAYLRFVHIVGGGPNLYFSTTADDPVPADFGPELTSRWEGYSFAVTFEDDNTSITVPGPANLSNRIPSNEEPYSWAPEDSVSNLLGAFWLTEKTNVRVILYDGIPNSIQAQGSVTIGSLSVRGTGRLAASPPNIPTSNQSVQIGSLGVRAIGRLTDPPLNIFAPAQEVRIGTLSVVGRGALADVPPVVAPESRIVIGTLAVRGIGRLTDPPLNIFAPAQEVRIGTLSVAGTGRLTNRPPNIFAPAQEVQIGSITVRGIGRLTNRPPNIFAPAQEVQIGSITVRGIGRLTNRPPNIFAPGQTIQIGTLSVAGTGDLQTFPRLPAIAMQAAEINLPFTIILPEAQSGNQPLVYSIMAGFLSWMAFDPTSRELSGTGPATGVFGLTYHVEDTDGDSDSVDFVLAIVPPDTMPMIPPINTIAVLAGAPFTATLPQPLLGNPPFVLEVDGRSAGISFDATTRELSGTLDEIRTYQLRYRVTDTDGDIDELDFSFAVVDRKSLPPGTPGNLTIVDSNIGQTWIGIEDWEPPTDGGSIRGWDIEFRLEGDVLWTPWPHEGIERTTLITGLMRNSNYDIRLRGTNENGEGDWNAPTRIRTRSRTVRHTNLVQSAFAHDTDQTWLVLLTLDHPTLPEPARVVNNLVDVVSRGETYIACPFTISLPTQDDRGMPEAQLQIENVSQTLIKIIRTVDSEVSVKIEIVRFDAPDTVEQSFEDFALKSARADLTTIQGTLGLSDAILTAVPIYTFSPSFFPGLFRT